jgi:hypothetical protein
MPLLVTANRGLGNDGLGMCSRASSIPYETVSEEGKDYQIRLYSPRFVVEMPYSSRDTAYMAFDQYLTGSAMISTCSPRSRMSYAHHLSTGQLGHSIPQPARVCLGCAGKNEGGLQLESLAPVVMRHQPDQVRDEHCRR